MIWLTKEQVINLHHDLIAATGGTSGLRDNALLESALTTPFQTFNATDLYPDLINKISRLAYGLVMNHPFIDGNKRIGLHSMLILCALNKIKIDFSQKSITNLFLDLANNQISYEDFHQWIIAHLVK